MQKNNFTVRGNFVDIQQKEIYPAQIQVTNGKIFSVKRVIKTNTDVSRYILPGFVDSHVHIESSMLIPSEFARIAVVHGTVGTISDPHEIANVCGKDGIEFMIANGKEVPFKFNFGAPSCVPATIFETAGATLDAADVEELLLRPEIKYLSEMMNFPGVLYKEEEVIQKIAAAHRQNKPVDGHAPGLRGPAAKQYIDAGISTDHECFTLEEALDKLQHGMKILIREGSAAKNFEALIGLLNDYPGDIMFCSDDKHPDSLVAGHINQLCARAVNKGIDVFKVLQAACINPVNHYKLDIGLLKAGDCADFIVVRDLLNFDVLQTYVDGELVADAGKSYIRRVKTLPVNLFNCAYKTIADFNVHAKADGQEIDIIEALDGQLITKRLQLPASVLRGNDNCLHPNIEQDILKIAVINRYKDAPVSVGWIKNFTLKEGAIASTVAHDSHNIIVTGCDDESMVRAVNLVIAAEGGISCVGKEKEIILPLPVAGLMSMDDGYTVAREYTNIDIMAKSIGSKLSSPFMTLSFMALLVIPHIKLSDLGLFDGDQFRLMAKSSII